MAKGCACLQLLKEGQSKRFRETRFPPCHAAPGQQAADGVACSVEWGTEKVGTAEGQRTSANPSKDVPLVCEAVGSG